VWRCGRLEVEANENPSTRQTCLDVLNAHLRNLIADGSSVLIGFDFPFGYPAGLAAALGLGGPRPWRAVWDELAARVTDNQAGGTNNRCQVASDLNLRVGVSEGPFWGRPQDRKFPQLHATEPPYPVGALDRLREADRHARGVQPVWKLWGNGSVGGQTLLGVPMLARLRDDDHLRGFSAVWPFETGCRLPPRDKPRIIFAEIYPSLVKLPADVDGRVKDSVQVEAIARHLARHDASDTPNDVFAAPATLESAVRERIETEEGWILGVKPMRNEPRAFT
jgi:precorrin-8X/cobalt-precorrin-8 methylmutase